MATEDHELLRVFVRTGSQEAFSELVGRHADLVSRVIEKRLGNAETGRDVLQEVFCCLARKAPRLLGHPAIGGWLVRAAVFESQKAQRKEMNRVQREIMHVAAEECRHHVSEYTEQDFLAVENALVELPSATRDAIMLRFYHQVPYRVIGERLGRTEDAAQKLVSRGVERLRKTVCRSEATILGLLASAFVMRPTPIEAAQPIAAAALNTISAKVSANVCLTLMTTNQIKLASALGLVALIPVAYQWKVRSSTDRSPIPPVEAPQIEPNDGVANSSPARQVSSTMLAQPRRAVPKLRMPQGWKARRSNVLVADLSDQEWKIRRGAAATIKGSDLPADLVVPALAKALADEEWQVRHEAALALATYGEEADSAVPAQIGVLNDEEWQVRNASAMALVSLASKAAVPALAAVLADEQWHVAANAAVALGGIGSEALDSTPALVKALDHEQWHVRNGAAYALGTIGASDSADQLRRLLQDEEPLVVKTATEALTRLEQGR